MLIRRKRGRVMEICDINHLHKRFLDIWEWCMRQGFDTRAFTYVEDAFKSEPTAELADRKTEPQMWTCPKCGVENHIDYRKCPCCGYDRKTENSSEKPNNFDKDINVRSKEPQISPSDCATCKHNPWSTPRTCGKCVGQKDGKPSMYEPKTEPQTERSE